MLGLRACSFVVVVTVLFSGCAQPQRIGMVRDPHSGIQSGSVVEKNIFIDSSQFKNKAVKVTTRNVSGDVAYDIGGFVSQLTSSLESKGYKPTLGEPFGLRVDVNVLYSGHVQSNLSSQYGFIGGAAGGVMGYRSGATAGTAAGVLVGATLGSIIGSYAVNDTYMILAELSVGINPVTDSGLTDRKTITFGSSPAMQREPVQSNFVPFREVLRTTIAVYAGGNGVSQSQVSDVVRRRLISIVTNSL